MSHSAKFVSVIFELLAPPQQVLSTPYLRHVHAIAASALSTPLQQVPSRVQFVSALVIGQKSRIQIYARLMCSSELEILASGMITSTKNCCRKKIRHKYSSLYSSMYSSLFAIVRHCSPYKATPLGEEE